MPRGRAQPPTLPGQPWPRSGGRGRCLLPAPSALPGAYRCGAPPGPGPQRLEGHSGGRASRPRRQAVSEELAEKAHPGARSGPHAPRSRAKGERTVSRGIWSPLRRPGSPPPDQPWRLLWTPAVRRQHFGNLCREG